MVFAGRKNSTSFEIRNESCSMTIPIEQIDELNSPGDIRQLTLPGRSQRRSSQQQNSADQSREPILITSTTSVVGTCLEQPFALTFAEPAPGPTQGYADWFQEHIKQSRFITYFVTFWIHWMAVLCMAAVFLADPEEFRPVALDAIFSDVEQDQDVLLEYVDVALEIPANEKPSIPEEVANNEAVAVSDQSSILDEFSMEKMPDALQALALDTSDSAEPAVSIEPVAEKTEPKPMVVPRHAVSAGSFAVWTEPENPDPGESYKIIIQIRLPDGTQRYSVADLEGVVVGSDGYQKLIPGPLRGYIPIQDGVVKLEVPVVSADKNVEDTVFIRSKILREAQRLRIQF